MLPEYKVDIQKFLELKELPGRWKTSDFYKILQHVEFEDVDEIQEQDLREICLMSLQDLEPQQAAAALLEVVLGEKLSAGQISNMASEMLDEKLWEDHADPSLHEELFNIASILYAVSPSCFPKTDAVHLTIEINAQNREAIEAMAAPLHESFLVRLLADGMERTAILHRFFEDQLAGQSFPEADRIVWTIESSALAADKMTVDVISSGYWLDALNETRAFSSNAVGDH